MAAYLQIKNLSDYPVISVLADEKKIFRDVLQNQTTSYKPLYEGRTDFTIIQNTEKPFLNTTLSLYPSLYYTLTIHNQSCMLDTS